MKVISGVEQVYIGDESRGDGEDTNLAKQSAADSVVADVYSTIVFFIFTVFFGCP